MVVRRLASNDHVVHVTFAQAGAGDTNKLRLLLQFRNAGTAEVSHAGAQPADKLEDHGFQGPTVGHASLNALGDKLGQAILTGSLALHDALAAEDGREGDAGRETPAILSAASVGLTFLAVVLGWVLFRAPTLVSAWGVLKGMAGWNGGRAGSILLCR